MSAPGWNAVELREGFDVCRCVRPSGSRPYARVGCDNCNGAGVVSRRHSHRPSARPAAQVEA